MGNRRLGRRRLKSVMEQNYSSTDEWGFVRPPMVPGLQRNIRVVALGQMHGFGIEDMTDLPQEDATTSIWGRDTDNSAGIVTLAGDADFTDGAFTLTTGGSSGHQTGVMARNTAFNCADSKKWWIETSIKLAAHDSTEFFFGLHERDVDTDSFHIEAAGSGTDRIGFVKAAHNVDDVTLACCKNAAGTISVAPSTAISYDANNDVLTMGIYWDGNSVKFYSSIAATGTETGALLLNTTISSDIPDDYDLSLQLMLETGAAATRDMHVNYIRGAWEI